MAQAHHQHEPQLKRWSTGLYNCSDDCPNCCLTCWCPCISFGRIAEITDKGNTSCCTSGGVYMLIMCLTLSGCQWIYSCMYRARFRSENHLPEEPCADCCVHFCCEYCSLCQMSRELKHRGWDLDIGYYANIAKKGGLAGHPAPKPMQGMHR